MGLNDCQIGRYLGIPFRTIQGWRKPTYVSRYPELSREDCPRCHGVSLDGSAYAYLLGMYLGDGMLSPYHRGVYRLQIALDCKYPAVVEECRAAMASMRNERLTQPAIQLYQTWSVVNAYWKHWPCLFPQHGPGPKHTRKIELAPWQESIASEHPSRLVRGLIHSDGWRGINRVRSRSGKLYEYSRYEFSNRSDDIRQIFCWACDELGIRWTRINLYKVAVSRRPDVAKLDELVGPKR